MSIRGLALVLLLAAALASSASAGASFRATVSELPASLRGTMTGSSWRPACPVGLDDLRLVRVSHWGFDGRVRTGRLIVHRDVASDMVAVLRRLYAARFPIRRMVPVDAYGASDFRSIEADNTSAFNCRPVEGTSRWSEHAYGRAIDLNPIENPYVSADGASSHRASRPYLVRTRHRPGMAVEGGVVVRAFDAVGWSWGGRWIGVKDYQHFSASGR
ncbi:MAG: M15 family metallopeptidase [Actinobacteria bacterium]|nr:M15 family metallopeptidase [Actinomycetota bacterium]